MEKKTKNSYCMSLAEISSYLNDVSMDNLKAGCIIDMGSLLGLGHFVKHTQPGFVTAIF